MAVKIQIESSKLLLVEGQDEVNFFKSLLKILGYNDCQFIDVGGKNKFPEIFEILIKLSGFAGVNTIGFIRDAEENMAVSAHQSICRILTKHRFPVTKNAGDIINQGTLRIGIYIMPDNNNSGMLEDLCLQSLKGSKVDKCVNDYMECANKIEIIKNDSKARVQSYLSSRSPIANSLGIAAQKGQWDFNNPAFYGIKQFLTELFN